MGIKQENEITVKLKCKILEDKGFKFLCKKDRNRIRKNNIM